MTFEHGLSQAELQEARNQYSHQKSRCKNQDRRDAAGNPVEMKMDFQEWLQVWISSGKYHLRGCRKGQFVMARKADLGHYEVGNVDIVPTEENHFVAHGREKCNFFGQDNAGKKCVVFKGTTVATNLATGEQIFMDGTKAITAAGFHNANVYACINGKRKAHHGYRFHRLTNN